MGRAFTPRGASSRRNRTQDLPADHLLLDEIGHNDGPGLNVLADSASPIDKFDVAELKAKIADMERTVPTRPVGGELDREIELLDRYRTLHQSLTVTTAL